jgi:hypothetical protein
MLQLLLFTPQDSLNLMAQLALFVAPRYHSSVIGGVQDPAFAVDLLSFPHVFSMAQAE